MTSGAPCLSHGYGAECPSGTTVHLTTKLTRRPRSLSQGGYMELSGIHHLTAISARIRDNHHFYTQTMGMRLVKRSVNQDDVSAYHLFYADAKGNPGTDLTFFDWPVPS